MTGRNARVRCLALFAAVLMAVPLAAFEAVVVAPAAGAAVTDFQFAGSLGDITAGPDGALWFTGSRGGSAVIGRITTAGVITTFSGPTIEPAGGLTVGSDGALWFTNDHFVGTNENDTFSIGRMTTAGVVSNFTDPSLARPGAITAGPDGALWFTNGGVFDNGIPTADKGSIGRITTAGVITDFHDPSILYPGGITAGPDGALWFTNTGGSSATDKGSIGRITTSGVVSNFTDPTIDYPGDITSGPDGNLWFTDGSGGPSTGYSIGRITTAGSVTAFTDPIISEPAGITTGPDGALWFTNDRFESVGRITTAGTVTSTSLGFTVEPGAITSGPDGALWFTDFGSTSGSAIHRITTGLTASAPTNPSAVVAVGQATLHWTAPARNGGAPITAYEITPYLGTVAQTPQVFTTTATTETVTGLTNGKTYQFKIAAQSTNGIGDWSAFTYPVTVGPPSPWKIVSSPTPRSGVNNFGELSGVSCTSPRNCFAVGTDANQQNEPLIERWNGSTWSIVAAPRPPNGRDAVLNSVSCSSATQCMTVGGGSGPLAEKWDGKRWSIVPIDLTMLAVSCTSATQCFAVGNGLSTDSVERWNGKKWSSVGASTANGPMSAVSCVSAKSCLAVGTVAERWNGSRWSTIAGPRPGGGIASVSCATVNNCMGVGQAFNEAEQSLTWAEQWNGTKWTKIASPNPVDFFGGILNGVSCTSPTNCVAVGENESGSTFGTKTFGGTLIEQWNGKQWSIVGSPNPTGLGNLMAVSCPSAAKCFAVGSGGRLKTLVEHS